MLNSIRSFSFRLGTRLSFGLVLGFVAPIANQAHADFNYDLEKAPTHLKRALDASQKLTVKFSEWGSSFFVSSDGYVITTLHSILPCFEPAWDYDPAVKTEKFEKLVYNPDLRMNVPEYRFQSFQNRDVLKQTANACPIYEGELMLEPQMVRRPRLVWTGKLRGSYNDDKVDAIPAEIVKKASDDWSDYVVLKYEVSTPVACVPRAQRALKAGEPVWLVSFPDWTDRNGIRNPAAQKSYSEGKVRASITEDPILQALYGNSNTNSHKWELQKLIWDQPRILKTSVDAYSASSGGVIVDRDGNAQAVLFSTMKASNKAATNATVSGLTLSYIYQDLKENLGQKTADEIFGCQ